MKVREYLLPVHHPAREDADLIPIRPLLGAYPRSADLPKRLQAGGGEVECRTGEGQWLSEWVIEAQVCDILILPGELEPCCQPVYLLGDVCIRVVGDERGYLPAARREARIKVLA